MNRNRLFVLPALTLALFPTSCGQDAAAERARQDSKEALESIHVYTNMEINDMVSKLEESWTELQVEVAKLKAEAKIRGEKAKASLHEKIAELEAKTEQAKARLQAARNASTEEASKAMDKLSEAYDAAKKSVTEAWSQLKK